MEGKLKLSEFLNDIEKKYTDNFFNYNELQNQLNHANNDDVKNPSLKLFISTVNMYGENILIPLKYTSEEMQGIYPVYNYNIYNKRFNEIQKIITRKQTIEEKVRANLVYKLNEEKKTKLSNFIDILTRGFVHTFYDYNKLKLRLKTVNNNDIKNPSLKLFILTYDMYGQQVLIPLKYKYEEIHDGYIEVYNYDVYMNGFDNQVTDKVITKKETIENKVRANSVYKLNEEIIGVEEDRGVEESKGVEEGRGVEESKGVEEGRGVEESKGDGSGSNVFVFDFDCTITTRHLFYFLNEKEKFKRLYGEIDEDKYTNILNYFNRDITITEVDVIEYFKETIFGDRERRNKLKIMLFLLGTENIYIASRGIKEQIIKALTLAELINFFDTEHITGGKKPKQDILNDLIETKNVFYTDDDLHEHSIFSRGMTENTNHAIQKILQYNSREHIYIFYNFAKRTNDYGGLSIEDMEIIPSIFERKMIGGNYYNLYKKYKTKYLRLKNSMNK
jgi:hypothetical protein